MQRASQACHALRFSPVQFSLRRHAHIACARMRPKSVRPDAGPARRTRKPRQARPGHATPRHAAARRRQMRHTCAPRRVASSRPAKRPGQRQRQRRARPRPCLAPRLKQRRGAEAKRGNWQLSPSVSVSGGIRSARRPAGQDYSGVGARWREKKKEERQRRRKMTGVRPRGRAACARHRRRASLRAASSSFAPVRTPGYLGMTGRAGQA